MRSGACPQAGVVHSVAGGRGVVARVRPSVADMSSPAPPSSSPAPVPSAARDAALAAHRDVAHATSSARRSLAVAWESTAADRFRDDVAALLADLDADLRVLEEATEVLAR